MNTICSISKKYAVSMMHITKTYFVVYWNIEIVSRGDMKPLAVYREGLWDTHASDQLA